MDGPRIGHSQVMCIIGKLPITSRIFLTKYLTRNFKACQICFAFVDHFPVRFRPRQSADAFDSIFRFIVTALKNNFIVCSHSSSASINPDSIVLVNHNI